MPNNDLGTAHGRIRIDFDDRGSAAANQALVKIQAEFEALNKRVAAVEKTFEKNNRALEYNSRSVKKTESTYRSYTATLFGADRITKIFSKDIIELSQDMLRLNKSVKETRERFKFFEDAYKVLDRFQQLKPVMPVLALNKALNAIKLSNLSEAEKKARAFSKALDTVGLGVKSLLGKGWERVWGKQRAIEAMPSWTRNVYQFATSLGVLGAAGIAVSKALNAGFITKFLDTGVFRRIVTESTRAGGALEKFGGITEKIFGRNLFGGMAASLKDSERGLSGFVKKLSHNMSGLSRAFNTGFKPIGEAARQIQMFTLGVGLMGAGIADIISKFKWLGKIPKPILTTLGVIISTIIPAAFQVLAKSLVFTSNALVGLWSGIQHLAGGLLALPGAIAQVGVVAGTLATIFGDLKTKFKDVFSDDPAKSLEAFNKLPEHLKPMAAALQVVVKNFKEMRTEIQKIAFKGIEDQIKSLGEKYVPLLKSGMTSVTLSLRGAKDEFVKFLEQGRTQKSLTTFFGDASETMGNLKLALRPVLDGLLDIATVGSRFVTDLSYGVDDLARKFATWAQANRESGQMMHWMQDAKKAVTDLVKGTADLTKGLWTVLTMFRTNTGTTWLDSYAAKMKQFKDSMKMSAQGGFIFDFSNLVKGFAQGRDKIDTFKSVLKSFLEMMKGVAPAIQNVSNAFSAIFIPQIKSAMEWIGNLANLGSMLHLDSIVGAILGLVAIFKLIPTFLGPTFNAMRILGGGFMALMNAGKVLSTVETGVVKLAYALEKIPLVGGKLSASLFRVNTAASGLMATFAGVIGPITAAIAAIVAIGLVYKAAADNTKEFDAQLITNEEHLAAHGRALHDAFLADRGMTGKTVMDQVSQGLGTMLTDLEDTASKAPGMLDHIAEYASKTAIGPMIYSAIKGDNPLKGGLFGESDAINKRQAEGKAAELAAKKYRELTKANVDLAGLVSGTQSVYDERIAKLRKESDGGKELADVLDQQRAKYMANVEAMRLLGPLGVELARGIDEMSRAGGNAASKLSALRSILTGLGLLKVDAADAAANYTLALDDLSNRIDDIINNGGNLADVWDAVNNSLNTSTVTGAKVEREFSNIVRAYQEAITSAKPEEFAAITQRLQNQFDGIASKLKIDPTQLRDYLTNSLGVVPDIIKIALEVDGKQDFAKDLGNFLLQLSASQQNHIPVRLDFNSPEAATQFQQQIQNLLGRSILDVEGNTVKIHAGIDVSAADLQKLFAEAAKVGYTGINPNQIVPANIPASAAAPVPPAPKAPIGPPVPAPVPGVITSLPTPPQMGPAPNRPPQMGPMPAAAPAANTSNLDAASAKADEVDHKLRKFASEPAVIEVNSDKLKDAKNLADDLDKKFSEKKLTADVQVNGMDRLQEATTTAQNLATGLTTVFDTLKAKIEDAVKTVNTKIGELSSGVVKVLEQAATSAGESGSKFVQALADGIATNPAAIQAAETLAAEIKKRFHQSPPKKGPLSAHGDAAKYGGEMFVESYATGLRTKASRVAGAADTVAGAAAGAAMAGGMGSAGGGAGKFLGQLLEMTGFASQLVGVFQKVSDTVARTMKFISDPMGKGTFFGGSLGFKKLSEAEIQKRRNEKDQQSLRSMYEGATRDTTAFDTKMQLIKDAENAVVDQKGYKSSKTAKTVGALIKEAFPEIATIGGARADSLPFHRNGNALDIMIPNWDTKEGKALGDRINKWALSNAQQLGVDYTIWQDFYQPTNGQPGNFQGNKDSNQGHYNHIHLNFAPGASIDLSGVQMTAAEQAKQEKQSAQDAAKTALQALQEQYGPPTLDPRDAIKREQKLRLNPDTGQLEPFTPKDQKDLPNGYLNPETKKPWTKAEVDQYVRDNLQVLAIPDNMTPERVQELINNSDFVQGTQREVLDRAAMQNDQIAKALDIAQNPDNYSNRSQEVIDALTAVDNEIIRLNDTGTVGNKQIASDLESVKSTILDTAGYAQNANPIDTISSVIGQAAGVVSDIIGTVTTSIEAVGAAKDTADVLVRGIQGTQDVGRVIDNVQKFIEVGASIAGSVASVSGLAGTIAGAAGSGDTSGASSGIAAALGAVSTVASLIQAGWETTNAVIDITQEAVKIVGSYVGDFLGYLVGGPNGGPLGGNVRFLLDQQTNQLLAYSTDNPMDKRVHNAIGGAKNPSSRDQQSIGTINVYGGPGSDPRDLTRQMMFQVNAARYAGALAQ